VLAVAVAVAVEAVEVVAVRLHHVLLLCVCSGVSSTIPPSILGAEANTFL
jgi:hypothetical protein